MSDRRLRGSITVFAGLSLLLVSSFLLALLEAARVQGLEAYSVMQRTNALESVFSEYDRELFERYGIFLLDGGYGSGALQVGELSAGLQEYSQKNLRPALPTLSLSASQNFYQMDVSEASVNSFLLATDADGDPFRRMAAAAVKNRYPAELLSKLRADLQNAQSSMDAATESQSAYEQAGSDIQSAKEQQAQAAAGEESTAAVPAEPPENPMDVVKTLQKTDILTLVLPAGKTVSEKTTGTHTMLERRDLISGSYPNEAGGWQERVLYQQFLNLQFDCYGSTERRAGGLDYELEYIVAGKSSDRENLKSVIRQLLLLREGANYLYLQTDSVKREEALALATAIAAAVGIAPAAGVIAQGILAAWAYAESVLDVRTLLAGGKISYMKTAATWSSSLSNLGALADGSFRAKESAQGEDYEGYLQKLLYLKSAKTLNYRAMDLIELFAERSLGRTIRMDAVILAVSADFTYEAEPLFSTLVTLGRLDAERLVFAGTECYSYLK